MQKEVLLEFPKGQSGRAILAPRTGKSKIVIDLIKRDDIKDGILWVTPTTRLATKDIPSEFKRWKAMKYLPQVEAVTWKGLSKITGHYGLIILDEEQFMTATNAQHLLAGDLTGNVIISMTGTESKAQVKKQLYQRLNLEVKYRLSINDAVRLGLLSDYKITVVGIDLDTKKNVEVNYKDKRTKKPKSFMTSEEDTYNYLTLRIEKAKTKFGLIQRRQVIGNSKSKVGAAKYIVNSLEGKRLVFAVSMKQAEEICPYVYHGKTDEKDLDKFMKGTIDKIAMVNKGGTGYTYTLVNHLIIVQIDSDTNGLTSQKITRALLKQGDFKTNIWILCLRKTQDEIWLDSTLENFDASKIEYINFEDLVL